ncbi:MAG: futalosine hydrolase [Desulfovibrio sp.]|nr:futalosine hydrolase [Desulfovibrio sp.]
MKKTHGDAGETPPRPGGAGEEYLLLVAATAPELRAALVALPGGETAQIPERPSFAFGERRAGLCALPLPSRKRLAVRCLVCGVGPAAAALSLGFHLGLGGEGRPAGVINCGYAGSYDLDRAPLGSVVLALSEHLPEYGVWVESDETVARRQRRTKDKDAANPPSSGERGFPLPLPLPQVCLESGPVFTRLELFPDRAMAELGLGNQDGGYEKDSLLRGAAATVAGVSGSARRAARMASLSGALVENMEGFALALACAAVGIPFIELRAVSNKAGARPLRKRNLDAADTAMSRAVSRLLGPVSGDILKHRMP